MSLLSLRETQEAIYKYDLLFILVDLINRAIFGSNCAVVVRYVHMCPVKYDERSM